MATRHRFLVGGRERTVLVEEAGDRITVAIDGGDPIELDATTSGVPGLFSILLDGRPTSAYVSRRGPAFEVTVEGRRFAVEPAAAGGRRRSPMGGKDRPGEVTAPLAGVVVDVRVAVGDSVEAGQAIVVIEAMKMQNEVQAPQAGTVTAIHCEQGGRVEQGALIVSYEPAST